MSASRKRGFTLVELMLAVSLFMILLAIAIPNYNTFKRRQTIRAAANKVVADLRRASTEALKSECNVIVTFEQESDYNSFKYKVVRDVNEDGVIDDTDSQQGGFISESSPTREYGTGRLWGGGIANNAVLTFGQGGRVIEDRTDLTAVMQTETDRNIGKNIKYYRIFITEKSGEINPSPGESYEIIIIEDGRVILTPRTTI